LHWLIRDVGHKEIHTVTLSYQEFQKAQNDETPLAAKVAAHYNSKHTTRVVTEAEFRADLPKIFDAMDQPTIDGINTWFVSKAARELGLKAAISGLGGDELFGGYPSFMDIPRWIRWCGAPSRVPLLGESFRYLLTRVRRFAPSISPKLAGLVKYAGSYAGAYLLRRAVFMPWELADVMDEQIVLEGLRRLQPIRHISATMQPKPRTAFGKVAVLEASLYMRNQLLRDTDWASMAHSLEVRVPLVDIKLFQSVAPAIMSLQPKTGKRLLATSPSRPLPREVINRSKTGFETPVKDWLKRDDRLQRWRQLPELSVPQCPWARRWAYQVASI